ncbi:hypothetical protein COCSUDRAFT_41663 [Coccomyxa subellipsoidea C-169]|uniref:Uncharacterized protein n=1 Tax=Coccomyxa subellipsoidea (strain C-169) TaxID=574566 RepID=I0YYE3_COCSC|nr:hypothetical protein COCSUDRAFT_41663 [Coccomyxa subellipsoidea C-169]EIE23412.1 hypothetical protein COCSUDRAFT_41663 [Coccomyxa subellipsoidea C-169]|eukprot:XP_005647956.1 hypothetical protein COCSUDRAFT_41663 [Coccomyxa subellipsoidea C-169]
MARFTTAAVPIGLAMLLIPKAVLGDVQIRKTIMQSTAWTKTGQDTEVIATPMESFQSMKAYAPGSGRGTPFRLDALTICIIGAVVLVNVGMVFCCARLACLKALGRDTDPLATEAAQAAAAAAPAAGDAGGGPGGGTAGGGPRIELTAVTHPNMDVRSLNPSDCCLLGVSCALHGIKMSFARRLSGRNSREEHTNDPEADAPLSANQRGNSDQRSTHLCASPTPKSLGCCAVPMVTLVIDSNECSAAA